MSADDGGNTYLSLDKYDINNWSDTSIIFTLPSRIDSSVVSGLGYLTQPPGSGALYVQNIETQQSNGLLSGLKIPYAATQVYGNRPITGEYYKNNLLLYANSIDSGYTYKLHTSITDENMKNCIRKAIREWSCHTGVKFKLDETATSTPAINDNLNVIQIDGTNLDIRTIAKTMIYSVGQCNSSDRNIIPPAYTNNLDIRINPNYVSTFFYDTTGLLDLPANKIDFYAVILHEIGHTHMLQYVNDEENVMWWNNGRDISIINASRRRIKITLDAQNGGNYIVTNSGQFQNSIICPVAYKPMPRQSIHCQIPNAIELLNQQILEIHPNPFENVINIEIDESIKQRLSVSLLDLTEKIRKQTILDTKTSNILTIDTSDIQNGVYILVIRYGNQISYKKVVRLNGL